MNTPFVRVVLLICFGVARVGVLVMRVVMVRDPRHVRGRRKKGEEGTRGIGKGEGKECDSENS
jgi:hypothetical protein